MFHWEERKCHKAPLIPRVWRTKEKDFYYYYFTTTTTLTNFLIHGSYCIHQRKKLDTLSRNNEIRISYLSKS